MRGLAVTLGHLGALHADLGDYSTARTDWWSALQLGIAGNDPEGVMASATNLSRAASGDSTRVWSALASVAAAAAGTGELAGGLQRRAEEFEEEGDATSASAAHELAEIVAGIAQSQLVSLGQRPPIGTGVAREKPIDLQPSDLPSPILFPHHFEVVDRPEGYRELHCIPSSWSYPDDQLPSSLVAELWSAQMAADPHGTEIAEFWSASDTARRLQQTSPSDLALRELILLSTRWETGLNQPMPWFSIPLIEDYIAYEEAASHVHFSQLPTEDKSQRTMWAQYGMEAADVLPILTGWDMRPGVDAPLTEPWHGAPGRWYSWSTVSEWGSWPRLQEAQSASAEASPGQLLLFVSHRWESLAHPDPDNRQLVALQLGLTLATARAVLLTEDEADATGSGLPELIVRYADAHGIELTSNELQAWAHLVADHAQAAADELDLAQQLATVDPPPAVEALRGRVLIWYDFASMSQAPRTPDEEQAFRDELTLMVDLQSSAGTVVIAGDKGQYVRRAWCFLELAVGMRTTITELTPSWGGHVGARRSLTRWASRTDQLIGALHSLGPDGIRSCGLEATNAEDLPVIGTLLASLPAVGRIESDDSDIVGGALPLPFRGGKWCLDGGRPTASPTEAIVAPVSGIGTIPDTNVLSEAAARYAGASTIQGAVGVWVYTTQRSLSLAWAAGASDLLAWAGSAVREIDGDLAQELAGGLSAESVACTWADPINLSDDGAGSTRFVPSGVDILVIVTQDGLPDICRIYERIRTTHLACGVTVVTAHPMSGRVVVERPDTERGEPELVAADTLVVPRARRSTVLPRQMMMRTGTAPDQVELIPALRTMPAEGCVGLGEVLADAADDDWPAGSPIDPARLLPLAGDRARVEALARSITSSWDTWARPRLTPSSWQVGMARLQLAVFEQLVHEVAPVSDNPLVRRKLLYTLIEDEEGYALPPTVLDDARALVEHILADRT